tara:strand:- start:458 stop:757 length:300 start_codon:yes stop_codon:yes gene_type:complete
MKDYDVFRQWLGDVMDVIYGPSHNWPFKALEKKDKKKIGEWVEPKNHDFSYPVTEYAMKKKPKRARDAKGRYKGDDKSTPNVNEAWVGGKAPKKKKGKK